MFHLLLSVLVAEFGCVAGLGEVRFLGINLVAWLLLLVALLALGGGMIATVFSYRLEKRERSGGARKFSARTALIANLIFVFVILMQSVPIFYFLHDC